MKSFLSRFGSFVLFVLSGFDRLRLVGESRLLNHSRGVQSYLWQQRILFRDFPAMPNSLPACSAKAPKPWPKSRTFRCFP
jgi:hypothetical protein